jgi:tetratricopeptide (TPR) repeat protein
VDGGTCSICLDGEEHPIQSGCACRGDAGLAHVACRAEEAIHTGTTGGDLDRWWRCGVCREEFTGVMAERLADIWWGKARHLPRESNERMFAAACMAKTCANRDQLDKGKIILQELLAVETRIFGADDVHTMMTVSNLATVNSRQGNHMVALGEFKDVLARQQRVLGPDDHNAIATRLNIAAELHTLHMYDKAVDMFRRVIDILGKTKGPESHYCLIATSGLINALTSQGKLDESAELYRVSFPVFTRVLGAEHPDTLGVSSRHARTLLKQGKFADAEKLLRSNVEVKTRLLGKDHVTTKDAVRFLDLIVGAK